MTTAPVDSDQARELLLRALNHDAVADAVTELLFEHVVGGRYERSEVAGLLRLRIQDPFHAATGEDWEALAEAYAASAGDLDPAALGETGAGRVHEYDGTRFDVGLLREFLATLLADQASADRIADATVGAGGHEASPSVIAKGLRSAAARALLSPSKEDWGAVPDQLIAQAREIDAEGRLGFYDLSRQRCQCEPDPRGGRISDRRIRRGRFPRPGRRIQGHADRAGERRAMGALSAPGGLRRGQGGTARCNRRRHPRHSRSSSQR